jgi:hypothetical protein
MMARQKKSNTQAHRTNTFIRVGKKYSTHDEVGLTPELKAALTWLLLGMRMHAVLPTNG